MVMKMPLSKKLMGKLKLLQALLTTQILKVSPAQSHAWLQLRRLGRCGSQRLYNDCSSPDPALSPSPRDSRQLVCMHFGSLDSCTECNASLSCQKEKIFLPFFLDTVGCPWQPIRVLFISLQSVVCRRGFFGCQGLWLPWQHTWTPGVTGDRRLSYHRLNLSSKKNLCSDRLPQYCQINSCLVF